MESFWSLVVAFCYYRLAFCVAGCLLLFRRGGVGWGGVCAESFYRLIFVGYVSASLNKRSRVCL